MAKTSTDTDTVTDKELDKLRSDNEKLRDQIADAEAERASREQALARQIEAEQLRAENARLQLQLDAAQAQAKAVDASNADLLDTIKESAAPAPVVDTDPDSPVVAANESGKE